MRQFSVLLLAPIIFFISLTIYTKLFGPIPFAVNSVSTVKQDIFNVTGEGKLSVAPDVALISLGVQASGSTVKDVQGKVNSSENAVISAVKGLGIDAKDIKTTNYSINPTYDYSSSNQKITGYQANSTVQVKVRDLNKVNLIIDAGTGAGANQVGGVTFDIDDKTKVQNEARKLAVADAKTKAEQAAATAGFSLGRLVNYQEDFGGSIRPMVAMSAGVAKDSGPTPPTQVEPGTNEIDVMVTLSYEIR